MKKKKEGFFSRGLFLIKHHLKRGDVIGHFPSNKEGFVASSHVISIMSMIKEKQIEDKIDLFMRN